MKRKRYTEEQIIAILKEYEAGASLPDIARRHGVAENTVIPPEIGVAQKWNILIMKQQEIPHAQITL